MLQPQPHIDLLISGPRRIRRRGDREEKKKTAKKPNRRVCKPEPLPGLCCDALSPHSWCLFCNVFHMVLIHRYSITESSPISSAVNATQTLMLTSTHANLQCRVRFSGPFLLLNASYLFHSLCCTFSERHTPPAGEKKTKKNTPVHKRLQIIPSMQHMPFNFHSFFPLLPPLFRLLCNEDAIPANAAATTIHHPTCARASTHTHTHTTSRSSSKPLRRRSSNSLIESVSLIWHWTSWLLRKQTRD